MAETPNPNPPAVVETPRGTYTARVDPKGRLKLPAAFQDYFEKTAESNFFVTTIDGKLLSIYPLSVWRQNEEIAERALGSEEEIEAAESVMFMANRWGVDASMDKEGRVSIQQPLRKALEIEDAQIWIMFEKGKITGYNELEFKKRADKAEADLAAKVSRIKAKGFR